MRSERTITQEAWSALRAALVGAGLSGALLRLGRLGLADTRRHLALHHLPAGGRGLEIGALDCPLPLPPGARALYVDKHPPAAARQLRPDADVAAVVTPDFLADGFRLGCVAEASQDFVVANHVLEHAADALGTLKNWLRVLRPGGCLLVAVPRGDRCFDRGREITPRQHFLDDHRLSAAGAHDEMRRRNRIHAEEHLAIAAPAIAREQGLSWTPPDPLERARLIDHLLDVAPEQMHHHVFSSASLAALLGLLDEASGGTARIERIARSSVELVGIVRRTA